MRKQLSGTNVRWGSIAATCALAVVFLGAQCADEDFVVDPGTPQNPVPAVTSVAPASIQMGGSDFILTLNGSGFISSSVVRWNGTDCPTTYVSSSQLTADMSASDIAAAAVVNITVRNPAPGGGTSPAHTFNVENPAPSITTLSPVGVTAGGPAFTLTLDGTGFINGSEVRWNGSGRTTTYVSGTQLTVDITAADIASGDSAAVTVYNSAPGGGESAAKTFYIQNDPPTLSSLSPDSAIAGDAGFTLTVAGAEFVAASVVRWDGVDLTTTFVSDSQLTASVSAADIATGDSIQVTVYSPPPGGGESTPLTFTVVNPAPTADSLSPTSAIVGGSNFTLTVNGSGFVTGSVVRWDGADRVTTFVDSSRVTATILAADIASTGTAQVTVFNPTPGGGLSSGLTFAVNNPAPTISSLSPDEKVPGSSAFTLTVNGTGFIASSVVRWDGADRTTTFVSGTQLTASITAADVAVQDTAAVTVFNPTPGGGESSATDFYVQNPTPVLTSISPNLETVSAPGFTITAIGSDFLPTSVVRWNGSDRTTTFVADTQLTASIPASDISTVGTAQVTVFNPAPGGGTSGWQLFVIEAPTITSAQQVNVETNDLVYDSVRGLIYASVPAGAVANPNSIAIIDPANATIDGYISVGTGPNPLAISDDGQYLYVGLDSTAQISRIVLATQTVDTTFTLGADTSFIDRGSYYAEDIEVLPGSPGSIAVSMFYPGWSPRHAGVAIFDDGVMRATQTGDTVEINRIEFGASASRIYGYNNETTEFGFRRLTVNASGVTIDNVVEDLIYGFNVDIKYSDGRVYASHGEIVDGEAGVLVDSFPVFPWGLMVPDSANHRVMFIDDIAGQLQAYDMTTIGLIGQVGMTLSLPEDLIRWGEDGVAFSNFISTTVSLIRTTLVKP